MPASCPHQHRYRGSSHCQGEEGGGGRGGGGASSRRELRNDELSSTWEVSGKGSSVRSIGVHGGWGVRVGMSEPLGPVLGVELTWPYTSYAIKSRDTK